MRLGNPAIRRLTKQASNGELNAVDSCATYKGVYLKAALFAFLTMATAILTEFLMFWAIKSGYVAEALTAVGIAFGISFIPLIIIALVIAFVPSTVKVLGGVYAVLQGALLGFTGCFVDIFYPGIALAAFLGTVIVFLVSLFVNSVFKVRISSKFARGLMIAFFSIMLVQLLMVLLSFTGIFSYTAYIWIQLVVSALCIIWATLMLSWDLQNIDYVVQSRADKKYEWIVAFSLVTTLIYLYVEILELLLRIMMLFGRRN
ncbi:MAG: Bax inhibitor-1/YccA family protein [Clostridia bacterium]|nr:Bax inhibitor-1/YccA family protein [Clostridia bacterium]